MAEYVAIMPTRAVQRDDAVDRLAEVVTMRRQLCDEHVTVENQTAHLEDAMLRRLSKRRLVRLEADIRLLDKRLAEMVATNAAFARLYELLTSMPGVGPVLAFTLIATTTGDRSFSRWHDLTRSLDFVRQIDDEIRRLRRIAGLASDDTSPVSVAEANNVTHCRGVGLFYFQCHSQPGWDPTPTWDPTPPGGGNTLPSWHSHTRLSHRAQFI
jgi:transposase